MKKERKILIAATEAVPFAKVGGLADVVGSLPRALEDVGANVTVVMPKYGTINEKKYKMKKTKKTMSIPMGSEMVEVGIHSAMMPRSKTQVYFLECDRYFDREGLYGENGEDYPDNDERFALFSRAVIEMCKLVNFKPDVIHCNDWQTGLIPVYLKTLYSDDDFYSNVTTVMTIHNIAYQGMFPHTVMDKIHLPWELFNPDGVEYWGHISYLKAGLVFADILNTVSPTYAREIQTSEEYGRGMEGILAARSDDLYGILNGLDYNIWNPMKDKYLKTNFDESDLRGKSRNKKALQKDMDMETSNVPVVAMISRLDEQKGFHLVAGAMEEMMKMDLQMVILGTGKPEYHQMLEEISKKYSDKTGIDLEFNESLAHRIYAGCDMFLMPSMFEPCGLGQMISMKYGALPVVHNTGGLADTVIDYTEDPDRGNGFKFDEPSSAALLDAMNRAMETYSNKRKWNTIVKRTMTIDHSWKTSALKYMELYEKAMEKSAVTVG